MMRSRKPLKQARLRGLLYSQNRNTKAEGGWVENGHPRQGADFGFRFSCCPALTANECTQLTAAAAVSLVRAFRHTIGIRAGIKWPNDIQIEGRKVAGILTEMSAEIDHVRHVILGIGIDVNQTTSDFTGELSTIATSLKLASGKTIDRARLAERILLELDADYRRILDRQFPTIAEEWAAHCTTLARK